MNHQVRIEEPQYMNLLGLLLAGFLQKQFTNPKLARKAKRLRGAFGIKAGEMAITITFSLEGISVSKGIAKKTRARIFGSMEEMIALVAGSGSTLAAIIAVLEGRIGIRGNPFALLGLLPIMIKKVTLHGALPAPTATHDAPASVGSGGPARTASSTGTEPAGNAPTGNAPAGNAPAGNAPTGNAPTGGNS